MSNTASNAMWARIKNDLPGLLAEIPARRRPSVMACSLVALRLAEMHREARGYTDETVNQLAEYLPLSEGTIRHSLAALDLIGWWPVISKGNHHRGTKRALGVREHREADPAMQHREADLTVQGDQHREVDDAASRGSTPSIARYGAQHREADLATPHSSPVNTPSSSRATTTTTTAAAHITKHVDTDPLCRITNPAAVIASQTPLAAALIETETAAGRDPTPALEDRWPTEPLPLGDFDFAAHTSPLSLMAQERQRRETTLQLVSTEPGIPTVRIVEDR